MTPQEAIDNLTFIRNAYHNLNENGADEFRIIGKGVNATVEYSKSSYSEYVMALDKAISALEKQTPKKPVFKNKAFFNFSGYCCPSCNRHIKSMNDPLQPDYCRDCGQALDWS